MPQVLTALRGNAVLSARWAKAFTDVGFRDTPIVTVNNAEDDALVLSLTPKGVPIAVPPFAGGGERDRVLYVAALYEQLIRAAKMEWVILWDDDILPPWRGIETLIAAARKAQSDVAGIVTVYPYEDQPDWACLYFRPYGGGVNMSSVPQFGLHQVWGGGTGLSIWRRAVLLETLPWGVPIGTQYGWDRDLAIKLQEKTLRVMAECSIRCRHDLLP